MAIRPGPRPIELLRYDRFAPVEKQIERLYDTLRILFGDIQLNTQQGLETHRSVASVPAADDLEDGQIVLGKDGATWKLYTKISGARYEVSLTAV